MLKAIREIPPACLAIALARLLFGKLRLLLLGAGTIWLDIMTMKTTKAIHS